MPDQSTGCPAGCRPRPGHCQVLELPELQYLPSHGLEPTGRHHEIYLSDLRRVAPEKLRTIIRQPVGRTDAAAG